MIDQLLTPGVAALLALVPAGVALWVGHAAARRSADPDFPERLAALRKRTGAAFALCAALLVTTARDESTWALPLLVIARMTAGYYVRRKLLGETWSLAAYFSFFIRLIAASFGFWLVLAVSPAVVGAWPSHPSMAAAVVAGALVLWSRHYSDAFRVVMRAHPIERADLHSRFRALADACALPGIWFGEVDLRGGAFANAVALPSIPRPAVVFSGTLLDRLTPDEAVGICAHEIAHLEHFNPRRLRRMAAGTYALIAVGAFVVPAARFAFPLLVPYVWLFWLPALVVAMAIRARDRQQNETASDLRAVALTGNPEALISALIKLHAMMHVARRWDPAVERQASHPSLARRIQAIRAAAGTAPPVLGEAIELREKAGQSSATLHPDRLHWIEDESVAHTIAYPQLSELRIVTAGSAPPKLRATTKSGHRWEMTLDRADVARAQAALDVIDSRLAEGAPASVRPSLVRIAAIAGLAAGLFLAQAAVALASLLALAQPSTSSMAAAGTASLAAALVIWLAPASDPAFVLLLSTCGAALLAAAYVARRERTHRPPSIAIGALCAATAIAWILLLAQGSGAWQLHQAVRYWPAATILPAAAAAALLCAPSRRLRVGGVPAALAAIVAVFLASPSYVAAFVHDSFITTMDPPPLRVTRIEDHPMITAALPFVPTDVRISANGTYIAAITEDDDEVTTVHAGRLGGPLEPLSADDAVFVGDARLLLLERRGDGAAVRVVALDDPHRPVSDDQPPIALTGVRTATLRLSPAADAWVAAGATLSRSLVTVTARFGESRPTERRWEGDGTYATSIVGVSDDRVLLMHTDYRPNLLSRAGLWQWAFLLGPSVSTSELSLVDANGVRRKVAASQLNVSCDGAGDLESTTCAAFDGSVTRLLTFDPAAVQFKPVAVMQGHFFMRHVSHDGWLTGWWQGNLVAVQPRMHETVGLADHARAYAMAASGNLIAAVVESGHSAVIQIYARPQVSARR